MGSDYRVVEYSASNRPARHKTITDQQMRAVIYRVEEQLSNAQIAVKEGVSQQAVGKWWKMPHVKRELVRIEERYDVEIRPKAIAEADEIRAKLMTCLKSRANDPDIKTSDVISGIKLTNEMIDKHVEHEIADSDGEKAKETVERLKKVLTPQQLETLVRKMAFGDKTEPLFDDTGSGTATSPGTGSEGLQLLSEVLPGDDELPVSD